MDGATRVLEPVTLSRTLSPPELLSALPRRPGRMLLESGLAGSSLAGGPGAPAPGAARWSFAAAEPMAVLTGSGNRFSLRAGSRVLDRDADPLALLDRALHRLASSVPPPAGHAAGDVPPFCGGFAGLLAYDLNRHVERLPERPRPGLPVPDVYLACYEVVVALDHASGRVWLCAWILPGREAAVLERLSRWRASLVRAAAHPPGPNPPPPPPTARWHDDLPRARYLEAVRRVLDYIEAGDVFQVNLARRFTATLAHPQRTPGWDVYLRLRSAAPGPFSAYIHGPGFEVASISPERFLYVEPAPDGWRAEMRPIKGTRRRGRTPHEDRALAAELLASEKDRAELTMIVDLCRNDLGRVARFGTVRVADLRRLESFASVHHTVATVEARLVPGVTAATLLRATFPAGSVTGAPKVRAMEIIDELEPVRRQVFCGAIGYLGFDGRLDLNVAIRTVTVAGGLAAFHAGGGIVADSDPEAEYEETSVKAQAMVAALGLCSGRVGHGDGAGDGTAATGLSLPRP